MTTDLQNTNAIPLKEILTQLKDYKDYIIHFAKFDQNEDQPLDVYMDDFDKWSAWNSYSSYKEGATQKDVFNRKYIFSLMDFYPEKDTWLFGGIWEVISRDLNNGSDNPYEIKLCDDYKDLIGRLKIKHEHKERQVRNRMENYIDRMELKEILSEPYSTKVFPGYKNIDISFKTLENIVSKKSLEWKNPLLIKGIYLITDLKKGKRYVGQAAGENGIWGRWNEYLLDGHGGNIDLKKLMNDNGGIDYARENYKFTLLEVVESNFENELDNRETYWKSVLLTRNPNFGYNQN